LKFALLLVFCFLIYTEILAQEYYYITSDGLNVRSLPNRDADILKEIQHGDIINVTEFKESGWSKVKLENGDIGFVASKFLTKDSNARIESKKDNSNSMSEIPLLYRIIAFIIACFLIIKSVFGGKNETKQTEETSIVEIAKINKTLNQRIVRLKKGNWYNCKYCNILVQTNSKPSESGCSINTYHQWYQLGEFGNKNYNCKYCNILVQTNSKPSGSGCSINTYHQWNEL